MTTVVGLAGASIQGSGGQWYTDYGLLPLQDKKCLWLDGAHKIPKEEMSKLAEAERSGKIEINKASKGEAWARTRQGKIMNPKDENGLVTTMSNFIYPVQAITNLSELQSIARIDLLCIAINNVSAKDRNKPMIEKHLPILENYEHLLKLVWSGQCGVIFEDGVMDIILEGATNLENKFSTEEIPLITNDQKYKLAKLSVALAGFTTSINEDYSKIIVKKEHVEYVINYIIKEYSDYGLLEIKAYGTVGEIDITHLLDIVTNIIKKINKYDGETAISILKWMSIQRSFTKDELRAEFDLSRDNELHPLIGYLRNENLIKVAKSGHIITKKMIAFAKYILKSGDSIQQELVDEQDRIFKTFKTFECVSCNTRWTDTTDSKEGIEKKHTGCVNGVKIIEIIKT